MAKTMLEALSGVGLATEPPPESSADGSLPAPTSVESPDAPQGDASSGYQGRVTLCPIRAEEVEPGLVAWLDPEVLIKDPRAINTSDPPVTRQGLFLCVAIAGEESTWATLTTTNHGRPRAMNGEIGRLELKAEWRTGGYRRWRFADHFLSDGASLWHGPTEVFLAASWRERSASGGRNRCRLDSLGLSVVRAEIELNRPRRYRLRSMRLSRQLRVERV